ncbi:hypothetical protein ACQY0O_007520 [Thecaphora frezii]
MKFASLAAIALAAGSATAAPLMMNGGTTGFSMPSFSGFSGLGQSAVSTPAASAGSSTAPSASTGSAGSSSAGGKCSSYLVISTRGTGELQGPSTGFISMNQQIQSGAPGGSVYNTLYMAGVDQNSALGTTDIVNKVNSAHTANPSQCFILQGYSQGAAATVNAMPKITGSAFDAVRAVILLGNPERKPNLECNVDANGGKTTMNVSGMENMITSGIPSNWVPKVLDICAFGDGVCDTTHGVGINMPHLSYPTNAGVQKMGADFAKKQLGA